MLLTDGYLITAADLHYESINTTYFVSVTATDGKNTATAILSINITDQNEVPVFNSTEYIVKYNESVVSFTMNGYLLDLIILKVPILDIKHSLQMAYVVGSYYAVRSIVNKLHIYID